VANKRIRNKAHYFIFKNSFFRVFFLDIPLDVALERLTQRSLDPITGDRFHTHDHLPHIDEIVRKRYQAYSIYYNDLQDFYSQQNAIHISADQDPYTVIEAIEAGIVNSINNDRY
jgi:adenylate kinase